MWESGTGLEWVKVKRCINLKRKKKRNNLFRNNNSKENMRLFFACKLPRFDVNIFTLVTSDSLKNHKKYDCVILLADLKISSSKQA